MQAKSLLYARRIKGDIDLGLEPARISVGDRRWAEILTPGGRLPGGVEQGILEVSLAQNYRLGTRRVVADRTYRYMLADTAYLLRAAYGVYPNITYAETGTAFANVTAGDYTVTLTAVAAVAADEFAEGILSVEGGAGYGTNYRIKSNTIAAAPADQFIVTLWDPIVLGLTAVTEAITLFHSPWRNVHCIAEEIAAGVVANLHKTSVIGIPNRFVPVSNYFWGQTWGPCMTIPAGGAEGVADNERMMAFQEDGVVTRARYEVAGVLDMQIAGWVLPVTTAGAMPGLVEIMLEITP